MKTLLYLFIFSSHLCLSQSILSGRIIDSSSHEPLPFVNITIKNSNAGTSTDIDGAFKLKASLKDTLLISYVGYEILTYPVTSNDLKSVVIMLRSSINQLREIEVIAEENPAFAIIRKVIANRKRNDPEELSSFVYQAYHKLYATTEGVFDTSEMKTSAGKFLSQHHLFMNETFTERKFIKPNHDKETIIGNQMSGVKDPFFAILSGSFQPFTFYKDHIPLLDKQYINPISPGTFDRYDFFIADTLYQYPDSVFIIQFEPLPKKTFEGLKGVLYINSNGYAIQNILTEPADPNVLMKIKIQQKYTRHSGAWFPEQLNTELLLKDYKIGNKPLKYVHRSYITDVRINPIILKKEFGVMDVEFDPKANRRDAEFWNNHRPDSLSFKEKNTYHLYDTLERSALAALNATMNLWAALITGKMKARAFYIPFEHLVRINDYEKYRLGFGLHTGPSISRRIIAEAYAGYGIKDKGLKYGGSLQLNVDIRRDWFFKFYFSDDVIEPGQNSFIKPPPSLTLSTSFRRWTTSRMDSVRLFKGEFHFRPRKNIEISTSLSRRSYQPTYTYTYRLPNGEAMNDFILTEAVYQFRYSKNERHIQVGNISAVVSFGYPQVNIAFSQGLAGTFDGAFDYRKIEFSLDHQFLIRGLGKTTFHISGGALDGDVPYSILFNGRGTHSETRNNFGYIVPNHFQTMGIYEFTSTRYGNFFIEHNFGRMVGTKSKYFRPELSISHGVGYGTISNPTRHEGINIQSPDKGFFEGGLIIRNLFRMEIGKLLYMGFGGGGFYRYGTYSAESTSKNIAWKIGIDATF